MLDEADSASEVGAGLPSYPKVWNIGHPSVRELFADPVLIEEKVDGSQFSFGMIDGELRCRSRGVAVVLDAAGMFEKAVATVTDLAPLLHPGWVYRAEYLAKPKHNALRYGRVPAKHLVLFDVTMGVETYLPRDTKLAEAERLGLEVAPIIAADARVDQPDTLRAFLDRESFLGGCRIEGIVVKNYARFGQDGKALFGKFVSEAFKEQHAASWKLANPQRADIMEALLATLRTDRRWEKAVERLRDAGVLESSPRDIGKLILAVQEDVGTECEAEIKEAFWKWAWPHLKRRVAAGLPEWYKQRLLDAQFAPDAEPSVPTTERAGEVA